MIYYMYIIIWDFFNTYEEYDFDIKVHAFLVNLFTL